MREVVRIHQRLDLASEDEPEVAVSPELYRLGVADQHFGGDVWQLPRATACDVSAETPELTSARRVLPGEPVHRLPDEVGMADVPRVLLDQVDQDAPQAG